MHVTGIITCHNYGDLVGRAMRSFLTQDYGPKHVLVIDDGSSDQSWEIIGQTDEDCTTIRLDQPHGPAASKNLAIRTAWDRTDAFAFLDADDEYLPGKLSRSLELMKPTYRNVGLVYSDEHVVDSVRRVAYDLFLPPFTEEVLESTLAGDQRLGAGGNQLSNFLVTKAAIQEAGLFDESLRVGENLDLVARVAASHVVLHVPEVLVTTRVSPRSLRVRVPPEAWARCRAQAEAKRHAAS